MARNINQIFAANPQTSVTGTSLVYLGVNGVDGAIQGMNLYNSPTSNSAFNNSTLGALTNQLILGTTNTTTINSVAPSASRVYTIPDAGASANFLMSQGTQTIAGANTFTSAVTINPASNQLILGSTHTVTINAGPNSSYNCAFPNATTDTSFIIQDGTTQTINGLLILSNTLTLNKTTNQLQLSGPTNTITITAPSPAASRTYTIPDAGTNSSFLMADGAQTANGRLTLATQLDIVPTTNQIRLGTSGGGGVAITINSNNQISGPFTVSFPSGMVSSDVFCLLNATQTLTNKTLASSCTLPESSLVASAWTDFSGTIGYTGFSGTPTTTVARYKTVGSITYVSVQMTGTSNSTSFTITGLPVAASNPSTFAVTYALDNGSGSFVAAGQLSASSTTITMLKNEGATNWTNTGTKAVQFSFFYENT